MIIRKLKFLFLFTILASTFVSCNSPVKKEVGLQLWSVRGDMKEDVQGTIVKLGEMGYSFIEAASYNNGKFYNMDPLEFKALCNESGLEFLSSHTGQGVPDSTNWDETMAWWDTCIEAHALAGVKYIVTPSMDKNGYGELADLKRYCDYFNVVGEKCNAKGIRFGYHNHAKEFEEVDGIVRYDYMLQNTDPKNVMFQLDLYWIQEGGKSAVEYFKQYQGRFELWHVKDEKELGESGKMDFASLFAEKEIAGMKHYIVEVERYNFPPLKSVEMSLNYLQDADYVK